MVQGCLKDSISSSPFLKEELTENYEADAIKIS